MFVTLTSSRYAIPSMYKSLHSFDAEPKSYVASVVGTIFESIFVPNFTVFAKVVTPDTLTLSRSVCPSTSILPARSISALATILLVNVAV